VAPADLELIAGQLLPGEPAHVFVGGNPLDPDSPPFALFRWDPTGEAYPMLGTAYYILNSDDPDMDLEAINRELSALRGQRARALRKVRDKLEAWIRDFGTFGGMGAVPGFNMTFPGMEDSSYTPTEAEAQRSAFSAMGRGTVIYIGRRNVGFEVFRDEGTGKYATIVGTKGRKFYRLEPTALDPFKVGAFEVLGQTPYRQAAKSKVTPGLPQTRD